MSPERYTRAGRGAERRRPDSGRRPRAEAGSASVLVAGAILCVVAVTFAGVAAGSVAAHAHHARSVADLAAVAGAQSALSSPDRGCAVASLTARLNEATLTACATSGLGALTVTVAVPLAIRWPGLPGQAIARSRAGPAGWADLGRPGA